MNGQVTKDLIHEGIATYTTQRTVPFCPPVRNQRPDSRRDCDSLNPNMAYYRLPTEETKDLIHEGIATLHLRSLNSRPYRVPETKDLIHEGIATKRTRFSIFGFRFSGNQRPDSRRDCDRVSSRLTFSSNFSETKDLIHEGIATLNFLLPVRRTRLSETKDLIHEGIATIYMCMNGGESY